MLFNLEHTGVKDVFNALIDMYSCDVCWLDLHSMQQIQFYFKKCPLMSKTRCWLQSTNAAGSMMREYTLMGCFDLGLCAVIVILATNLFTKPLFNILDVSDQSWNNLKSLDGQHSCMSLYTYIVTCLGIILLSPASTQTLHGWNGRVYRDLAVYDVPW